MPDPDGLVELTMYSPFSVSVSGSDELLDETAYSPSPSRSIRLSYRVCVCGPSGAGGALCNLSSHSLSSLEPGAVSSSDFFGGASGSGGGEGRGGGGDVHRSGNVTGVLACAAG